MNDNPSDDVGVGVVEYCDRGGGRSEGQFFIPIDVHKDSMVDPRTHLIQHFALKCSVRRGLGDGDLPGVRGNGTRGGG